MLPSTLRHTPHTEQHTAYVRGQQLADHTLRLALPVQLSPLRVYWEHTPPLLLQNSLRAATARPPYALLNIQLPRVPPLKEVAALQFFIVLFATARVLTCRLQEWHSSRSSELQFCSLGVDFWSLLELEQGSAFCKF